MPRMIPFQNPHLVNFRDFGGYMTSDGRKVKEGIFFRSGTLAYLTSYEDQKIFQDLHIRTVFDLRSQQERRQAPDIVIGAHIQRIEMSAMQDRNGRDFDFHGRHMLKLVRGEKKKKMSWQSIYLRRQNEILLFHNPTFKRMFSCLLHQQTPILIHCTAGKDRTGAGVALILLLLGVDKKTILEDYCLTNTCRKKQIEQCQHNYRWLHRLFPSTKKLCLMIQGVIEENLATGLAMIDERYDRIEDFFFQEYQLTAKDIQTLRTLYLETLPNIVK